MPPRTTDRLPAAGRWRGGGPVEGAAGGGDLSGTFPNPVIADGAVGGSEPATGAVSHGNLSIDLGASQTVVGATISARGCSITTGEVVANGTIVIPTVPIGQVLPQGLYLSVYAVADGVARVPICNGSPNDITVDNVTIFPTRLSP